jgi:hypothetical protein
MMEHYGKYADFTHLMTRWVEALVRSGQFLQQMDPDTGEFSPDRGVYSPAMLALFDFVWRLYGVRPCGDTIEWTCRQPEDAGSTTAQWGTAELRTDRVNSALTLAGKQIAKIRGTARIVTTTHGELVRLIGAEPRAVTVLVQNGRSEKAHNLKPDSVIAL